MKLTVFEKFMYWLGYRYVYNKRSKEIHCLENKHVNCNFQIMSRKNKRYMTESKAMKHLMNEANGCRWCMSEFNNG